METARQAWLKTAALPLLRGLRRDELMRFFVRNAGGGRLWGVWLFTFPSLAAAADPREAACVSWLIAEVMPETTPRFLRAIVLESEQRMRLRLRLTPGKDWSKSADGWERGGSAEEAFVLVTATAKQYAAVSEFQEEPR